MKTKNKILKQSHERKVAQSFSPKTKKSSEVIESTQKLGEVFAEPKLENENTQ